MAQRVAILGVPIDNVSMAEALERIEKFIAEGSLHQIATANADFLRVATKHPDYKQVLSTCDLVVADGMPLVWASRMLGCALRERVAGVDLVQRLAELSQRKQYGIYLLGAEPHVSEVAARRMENWGARIVGRMAPAFSPLDRFDNEGITATINRANPDILLVAFGSPKQELWIHQNRARLRVPVCIGVGGSLDMLGGAIKRAPTWMQQAGLEWLHRLRMEPRRLASRYILDAVCLARYLTVQLASNLVHKRQGTGLQVSFSTFGSVQIVSFAGDMAGSRLSQMGQTVIAAMKWNTPLVIEMSQVNKMGADGLGLLTAVLRGATHRGCQLWLAGLSQGALRALRASGCEGLFRCVPSVWDAIRHASGGRLQFNLEMGDGWAVGRIGGELPAGARSTLERICRLLAEENDDFEFDVTGVPGFDPSGMLGPTPSKFRLIFNDTSRGKAKATVA
jgi:N-acetylglucosaminyldiphosphoundecaprenol N-acetyl-beta-D-mannosaminyltransferase